MRTVLLVARREIAAMRLVLAGALAAGVMALAAPLLLGLGGATPAADARDVMAPAVAATFAVAIALMYGASCIARDLRERRLSFYFSRPLPAASLWAGKMLAAVVLTVGSAALAVAPALALSGPRMLAWFLATEAVWPVALVLALPFLAHAVAIMLSSRSAWLALDFAGLVLVGTAAAASLRAIWLTGASELFELAGLTMAAAAFAALAGAGLVQVAVGRTDPRRGHRALSLALWSALGVATAGLGAWTIFLLHPTPGSLTSNLDPELSAHGSTLVISGGSRWRGDCRSTFVIDTATGRWVRAGVAQHWNTLAAISGDGSRAAWPDWLGRPGESAAVLVSLAATRPNSRPEETTLVLSPDWSGNLALSDDGGRVALVDGGVLAVHELPGGRLLTSVRVPRGSRSLAFDGPERLRLVIVAETSRSNGPRVPTVYSVDVAGGSLVETGRLAPADARATVLRTGPGYRAVLVYERRGGDVSLVLRDGRTGHEVAVLGSRSLPLPDGELRWPGSTTLLDDGTVVVGEVTPGGARLRRFAADGRELAATELGRWAALAVGAELMPRRLAVGVAASLPGDEESTDWTECFAVDLDTGERTPVGRGVRPWASIWQSTGDVVTAGSLGARLFLARDRALSLWDPGTGRLRPLLAR